jgi:hypothetical protein
MRVVLPILQKVLVNHFYRVNTGFFLFMFFVLFGMPANLLQFHMAIIYAIIQNPTGLAGGMLIWLLYNVKCMDYVIKQLRSPQQQFLFCLNHLSPGAGFAYCLYVQALVYMPVLAYSLFVAAVAVKMHLYLSMAAVLLFTAAVLLVPAAVYLRVLQRRPLFKSSLLLPQVNVRLGKPLFMLPLFYMLQSRRQMLLVTKAFSLGLLYVFLQLYQGDHYDIRPLLLCFMLAIIANSAVVYQVKAFEDSIAFITKNFPLPLAKRFVYMLAMYIMLMLPELLLVWKGYPVFFTIADYLQLVLLAAGLLSLYHGSLLTDDMETDPYFRIVFAVPAILFFVILYNPGILLECLLLAVSCGLYASYYYGFEKKYD